MFPKFTSTNSTMSCQHNADRNNTTPWLDTDNPPPVDDAMIHATIARGHLKPRLTRAFLKKQSNWMDWALSEYKQLKQYYAQSMFGDPIKLPPNANILLLIWIYLLKSDGNNKVRCVCSRSSSPRVSVTLAHTHDAALDQSDA